MIEKKNYDKEEKKKGLVPYVRELIGDRSIRQASADIGIAASYLSGILKGTFLPSAEVLRKMSDEKAFPQGGVTLEDLMVAAGYQQDYVLTVASKVLDGAEQEGGVINTSEGPVDEITFREEKMRKVHERYRLGIKFAKTARALILSELAQKNISFTVSEVTAEVIKYKFDLILHVPKQPILEWLMDVRFYSDDCRMDEFDWRHMYGNLLFLPPKLERKVSIVLNNINAFETLSRYAGKLSYRGDLSIILVDIEEMCIRREVYLSHYRENEKESEFYIV